MRIAISNVAWNADEDIQIAGVLARFGVDAIDVAPTKYFPDPTMASDADVSRIRRFWADRGVEITGMQSLLFGGVGLNIFGSAESRNATLDRLSAVCRIAAMLGASRLVFGSFKNRDRSGLDDAIALDMVVSFFQRLAEIAHSNGVFICLEAVPKRYGANFMTTTAEAAHVVAVVDRAAIRLHLDTGTMAVNGEEPRDIVRKFAHLIGHVHASEPDLAPIGDRGADHSGTALALAQHLPGHVVSVETFATENESHIIAVERSLAAAVRHYRDNGAIN